MRRSRKKRITLEEYLEGVELDLDIEQWKKGLRFNYIAFAKAVKDGRVKRGLKHDIKAQCRKKREVKSCEECLRFHECENGKKYFNSLDYINNGEKALASMIVEQKGHDFVDFWKKGYKNNLTSVSNWLKEWADFYTLNDIEGTTFVTNLTNWCTKKYGDFENIYNKRMDKLNKQMESALKEYEHANEMYNKKKIELRELTRYEKQISRIKAEMVM